MPKTSSIQKVYAHVPARTGRVTHQGVYFRWICTPPRRDSICLIRVTPSGHVRRIAGDQFMFAMLRPRGCLVGSVSLYISCALVKLHKPKYNVKMVDQV